MRASRSLTALRLSLITALAVFSINCEEGEDCGCLDTPPPPPAEEDDPTPAATEPIPRDLEESLSALPACAGGVDQAFTADEVDPPEEGSEGYLSPSSDTLEALLASFASVERGETQLAHAQVAVVGYELCRGEGDEEGVVLWRPSVAGVGRALFALRLHAASELQIGVPHAWQHPASLQMGRRAFQELRARTLVSSGTWRCANVEPSGCAGDDACGDLPVVSDMAYSRDTVFQVAHELFADAYTGDVVVALEGRTRPGTKVSEGVAAELVTGGAARRFMDSLIIDGEPVTGCPEESADGVSRVECGLENVQGLYVNGVAAACGPAEPPAVVGRFLHVASSSDVYEAGDALLDGLDAAIP